MESAPTFEKSVSSGSRHEGRTSPDQLVISPSTPAFRPRQARSPITTTTRTAILRPARHKPALRVNTYANEPFGKPTQYRPARERMKHPHPTPLFSDTPGVGTSATTPLGASSRWERVRTTPRSADSSASILSTAVRRTTTTTPVRTRVNGYDLSGTERAGLMLKVLVHTPTQPSCTGHFALTAGWCRGVSCRRWGARTASATASMVKATSRAMGDTITTATSECAWTCKAATTDISPPPTRTPLSTTSVREASERHRNGSPFVAQRTRLRNVRSWKVGGLTAGDRSRIPCEFSEMGGARPCSAHRCGAGRAF